MTPSAPGAPTWVPHAITPSATAADLGTWLDDLGPDGLSATLVEHKAIVFRGFAVPVDGLDPVLDRLLPNRLPYVHGNSPRTRVQGNVYTSTEYPQELTISMHNELCYAHAWPARLAFYCQSPPDSGGATPVVDGQRWLAELGDDIRSAFADGVRYVQNLHDGYGLGKSWQDTFETDDPTQVESFLAGSGAEWTWRDEGLRVEAHRPATVRHPVTGAEVWFNQADQWHPAGLEGDTAAELYDLLDEDELPQFVTFADGSPIPDEYVTRIRDRGLAAAVDVDWHHGDLLLVDNVAVAHGRRPFTGARRVLVAMSD
jgi:alpha-ketoglutarate-dependent taurine dioxygenase